ncbi:MAG: type I DNA topoisomerase [Actinomycetota bacterium]|nr:type I DNA topoisomerase [Actinomycetota bacterium]
MNEHETAASGQQSTAPRRRSARPGTGKRATTAKTNGGGRTQLVVVESPTKAKTIERYLGAGYRVIASYGHIRDLPKSDFAVQAGPSGCALDYEVPKSSQKYVTNLKREARKAERIWLALDLDREGEAIAWHVAEVLELPLDDANRVTFDEITQEAIRQAFAQPRPVDLHLVNAQQARRAVDRIVGYRLSPVLWRTVSAGISAGRVQSVGLRLVVDRENEIRAFVPQEYWTFDGTFDLESGHERPSVEASLHRVGDRRLATPRDLERAAETDRVAESDYLLVDRAEDAEELKARALAAARYEVREVRRSEQRRNPPAPFTTSTLQQEAARKLRFTTKKTMAVAQQLYEGVELGAEGQVGLITYMRTDSLNVSEQALRELNALVRERFGDRYALDEPRRYQTRRKRAQEAHEAIRPTSALRDPERVRRYLDGDQYRLYELIWRRTVATQMAAAVFDRLSADLVALEADGAELAFRATGQVLRFDGFLAVYEEGRDDEEETRGRAGGRLPDLEEGQWLTLQELGANQHFTQPPPRYSEATLVKTLEAEGIGRPSTYAQIISTIMARNYVQLDNRRFVPTPLGEVVTAFLKAHFGEVVDVGFTARMEDELDEIAEGRQSWCGMVYEFLEEVDDWVHDRKPERPRLPLVPAAECPRCGAPMEKVFSGKSKQWFASCSRWPDCEGTLPLDEHGRVTEPEPEPEPDERVRCPECGKPMVRRSGRFGEFYGCVDYPACKGIVNVAARTPFGCPKCGEGRLDLRKSRYGKPFVGCSRYPDCDFAIWSVPLHRPCPTCGAPLKPPPRNRKRPIATCSNPEEPHKVELADFDPPRVVTIPVVPDVPGLDPDLPGYEGATWDEVSEEGEEAVIADPMMGERVSEPAARTG